MKTQNPEVLVVGAGPVGMFTALNLVSRGIKVRIVDMGSGPAGHSYACALHCRTVRLLEQAGINLDEIPAAQRLERIAFYEGTLRRAEISFNGIVPASPHVLVVPQCDLEELLGTQLKKENVPIEWNHRVSDLRGTITGMTATLQELGESVSGYAVPQMETVVKRTSELSCQFVVGCDGRNSVVRRFAGINYRSLGEPELFVVYEFESDFNMPNESRVVLNRTDTNVLWPMGDRRFRWSFQWTRTKPDGEFPGKDRTRLWGEDRAVAEQTAAHLKELIRERAPWFEGSIENIGWATDVQFEHRMAEKFGAGRYWLAGDAAHQTGPAGVQSLNVGMHEAEVLARDFESAVRSSATNEALQEYEGEFLPEWQRLLGIDSAIAPLQPGMPAALRYPHALVESMPAHGPDLDAMLAAVGFRLQAYAFPTSERR